jgi:Spy/CpxP family protein refolding chaperone
MWTRQPAPRPADWLARELGLTPEQQTRLAALDRDFSGKCDTFCEAMCAARVALADELQRADSVTPRVEELLAKLQAAQAANERETLRHLFLIKSLLTPDQQRRYAALITGKLCGNCRHSDHHPELRP